MTPTTLVNITDQDDKEIVRLLQSIKEKQEHIEQLTMAMEEMKEEVDLFQHRYNTQVGNFYLELDKVEIETQEYRLRLKLRREDVSEDEIEKRVEACFKENKARLQDIDQQKDSAVQPEADLPEQDVKKLQKLYRKLAKIFHPDKVEESEHENNSEQIMPLINRAYHEQDIQTLERLSIGYTEIDLSIEHTLVDKRKKLHSEIRNLNRVTSELKSEINRIKAGKTYQLKKDVETAEKDGTDLLSTLANDVKRKLKVARSQLTRLISFWSKTSIF